MIVDYCGYDFCAFDTLNFSNLLLVGGSDFCGRPPAQREDDSLAMRSDWVCPNRSLSLSKTL
jgi:hypothetical protein